MKIYLDNLFGIDSKHGLNSKDFKQYADLIPQFLQKIHERNQGFYSNIDDNEILLKINHFAEGVKGRYRYIVVLGIGGSALGTLTLLKSLKPECGTDKNYDDPKLFVLDNIDPDTILEVEDTIELAETLFLVVSKSGGTIETLAQYFYFKDQLKKSNLDYKEHVVFVTDPDSGALREMANTEGLKSFKVPKNIGGRFSVLTPVSLLPARLIGLQINDLIEGAQDMRDLFLSNDFSENLPFQLAVTQYLLYQKQKSINVLMPYTQKLITFTAWYSQLLAESIGKDGKGITPLKAVGASDQHSLSQLFHDGPNDKLIIFIRLLNFKSKIEIPDVSEEYPDYDFLKDTSFAELLNVEQVATERSLTRVDRPNITIEMGNLTEKTIGSLFMLFESATAILGELMQVNAFDQPGVEMSKVLTKEYLQKR